MLAVYGWRAWQGHQQSVGEAASDIYFDLLDASALAEEKPDEANKSTVNHLAEQLKTEYESTSYALYAALLAAKQAVVSDDLAAAEQQIQWVVDRSDEDSSLQLIARLRLARVIYSQGGEENAKRALALIESTQAGSHTSAYEEVKGDIYLELGRVSDARQAYQAALTAAGSVGAQKPLLTIKLNDLAQDGES